MSFFETLSCRIAATRNSSFVKNFGWLFCMNGINRSGIAAVLLRLSPTAPSFGSSSSNLPYRKPGRIIQKRDSENMAQ
jgi:hypothetical protein